MQEQEAELIINQYLSLKLINGKTKIYVGGEEFLMCKNIVLNVPKNLVKSVKTMDDLIEVSEITKGDEYNIDPKTEFWVHCSNFQVWHENDYNTDLLEKNLAFPLLQKLTELGDQRALGRFKEEIARRYLSGSFNTKQYLTNEGYLDYLSQEELILGMRPKESNLLLDIIEHGKQSDLTYETVITLDEDKVRHRTADSERFLTLNLRSLHEIEFDLGDDFKSLELFRKFPNFSRLVGIILLLGKINGIELENQPSLESVKWVEVYQSNYTTTSTIPARLFIVFPNATHINIYCMNSENLNLNSLLSLKKLETLWLFSRNTFNEKINKQLISLEKKGVKIFKENF